MKKKSLIEYAVTFAVFFTGQLFLLMAKTPFCTAFAAVITLSTTLTLLITKRYIPAAVFALMCLIPDLTVAAPGQHFAFYIFAAASVLLSFGSVILANKTELGLLLSDLAGVATFYVPFYLCVKHIMPKLTDAEAAANLMSLCGIPLMIGVMISAVVTFFAVPAANVITRDGF